MKWLTQVTQQIDAHREFPEALRSQATHWAGELSGICDVFVPGAPAPRVSGTKELFLVWRDPEESPEVRSFILCFAVDGSVALSMHHTGRNAFIPRPTHEQVKTNLRSFFE